MQTVGIAASLAFRRCRLVRITHLTEPTLDRRKQLWVKSPKLRPPNGGLQLPSVFRSQSMRPFIVLIEDSPTDTRWFLLQLREVGAMCDVLTFASGEAALQGLRDMDTPDLIVTDWHLPMIGGAALIKSIKRIRGLESVPVIVL